MHEETKIEMKLEEETKPIKKVCEKVMDIVSTEFEKGAENVDTKEMGEAIDILKDLYEAKEKIVKACYYKYILSAMEKEETEEEEYKKVMEKMREQYNGDDEDMERRFYDNYRYKRTGRYAPKGRGSYVGRRGYEEPMYYMPLEMYHNYTPEELRDFDREQGRMYYSSGMGNSGNMSGGGSSSNGRSGGMSGSNGGNSSSRGYSDGYDDGNRRGYSEGYERGRSENSNNNSRYDRAKRGYEEKKEMHKGNTAEDNAENMRGLEEILTVVGGDVKELMPKMTSAERLMASQKFDNFAKMLKQ